MAQGGIQQVLVEQQLLDQSFIEQLSVDDLRNMTPAVYAQLDRLSSLTDKIYVHIDMDVLDPREVMGHGNKVPNGPSSEELARLFEAIFSRCPKASASDACGLKAGLRTSKLAASRQIQDKEFNYLTALAQCLVGTSESLFSVMVKDGRQTGAKYHSAIETEVKNA